jgi:WD40 repeat protein
MQISGDPGSARIDFSPDGRYAIIAPKNADGSPLVWDLRSRKEVGLKGELKDLRWATYAFAGPDRLVLSRDRKGLVYSAWVSAIVTLPSAQRISKLNLPRGTLSRSADPGFIMVQTKIRGHSSELPFQAIEYRTGRTIGNETAAMDVFPDRYIVQRPGKGLELHVDGQPVVRLEQRRNNIAPATTSPSTHAEPSAPL